MSWNRQVLGNR